MGEWSKRGGREGRREEGREEGLASVIVGGIQTGFPSHLQQLQSNPLKGAVAVRCAQSTTGRSIGYLSYLCLSFPNARQEGALL